MHRCPTTIQLDWFWPVFSWQKMGCTFLRLLYPTCSRLMKFWRDSHSSPWFVAECASSFKSEGKEFMIPMTKIYLSTINKNPEVYRLQSRLLTNLQNLLASVSFHLETNCQVDLDSLDKTGMFFPATGTWSLWAAIRPSISAMASLDIFFLDGYPKGPSFPEMWFLEIYIYIVIVRINSFRYLSSNQMSSQQFLFKNWHLLISMVASNDTSEKKKMYQNHNISLQNHKITKCRSKTWLKNLKKITKKNWNNLFIILWLWPKICSLPEPPKCFFLPMMSSKKSTDDDANVFRAPKKLCYTTSSFEPVEVARVLGLVFNETTISSGENETAHCVSNRDPFVKGVGIKVSQKIQNLLSCFHHFFVASREKSPLRMWSQFHCRYPSKMPHAMKCFIRASLNGPIRIPMLQVNQTKPRGFWNTEMRCGDLFFPKDEGSMYNGHHWDVLT